MHLNTTLATLVASQSPISGALSLTRQMEAATRPQSDRSPVGSIGSKENDSGIPQSSGQTARWFRGTDLPGLNNGSGLHGSHLLLGIALSSHFILAVQHDPNGVN